MVKYRGDKCEFVEIYTHKELCEKSNCKDNVIDLTVVVRQ